MPEMQDGLNTWLKRECVNIGTQMMGPLSYLDDTLSAMYDDDTKTVVHSGVWFTKQLFDIAELGWITGEELALWRRDVDGTIGKYLAAHDSNQDALMFKASQEMYNLQKKWGILLLERTVECQCGKP